MSDLSAGGTRRISERSLPRFLLQVSFVLARWSLVDERECQDVNAMMQFGRKTKVLMLCEDRWRSFRKQQECAGTSDPEKIGRAE